MKRMEQHPVSPPQNAECHTRECQSRTVKHPSCNSMSWGAVLGKRDRTQRQKADWAEKSSGPRTAIGHRVLARCFADTVLCRYCPACTSMCHAANGVLVSF